MSLSRKRKKELRKLQQQANSLWESQQVLIGHAGEVAREAGRQLGHYNREQVVPVVQEKYDRYAAPYVERGVKVSKQVYNDKLVPTAGAVLGSALSVWDAANEKRVNIAVGRGGTSVGKRILAEVAPPKKGMGAGGVLALLFGIAAAAGVLYAAWQTLRADDELWVADDPLRAPDA